MGGRSYHFIQRAQCLCLVNVHKKQTRLATASFRIFSLSFLRRVGHGLRLQQGRLHVRQWQQRRLGRAAFCSSVPVWGSNLSRGIKAGVALFCPPQALADEIFGLCAGVLFCWPALLDLLQRAAGQD